MLLRWAEPRYLIHRPEGDLAQLHRYSPVYGWEPRPDSVAFVDGQRTTERSHLFTRLVGQPPPVGEEWRARRDEALQDAEGARDLTFRLVARVDQVVRGAGASMVIVVHPGRREFREGSPWLDALKQAPALSGITQVDMGERFRERGLRLHDLTLDPIGHLNPGGHREAASVLSSVLPPARAD